MQHWWGLLTLSLGVCSATEARGAIAFLQWNPHWECFVFNETGCRGNAEAALSAELVKSNVDFANVIELDDTAYRPPLGWHKLVKYCGKDVVTLFYSSRWVPSLWAASHANGCMALDDRPFIVQQFNEVRGTRRIVVVGAHYPHGGDREALKSALGSVVNATGVSDVVLIADTNEESDVPNSAIMEDIGAPDGDLVGTALSNTCCFDDDFSFNFTFDRIITNFGHSMNTTVLFGSPVPAWAQTGAFHKAVRGVLHAHPSVVNEQVGGAVTPSDSTGTLPLNAASWLLAALGFCAVAAAVPVLLLQRRRAHGRTPRVKLQSETDVPPFQQALI